MFKITGWLPVLVTIGEQAFRNMPLIKNRSTMGGDWLNHLMVLSIEHRACL